MHGLPRDLDLTALASQLITQVAFGEHQVIMRFDEGATLSIEVPFEHTSPDGTTTLCEDYANRSTSLTKLLGENRSIGAGR